MRLDFNVLWVEDLPSYVQSQKSPIQRHMEEQGFLFNVTHCQTIEEVQQHISSDIFSDEVDLVLVDWDLGKDASGNDVRGQTVIQAIREQIPYKDVIFYSGQAALTELRDYVHEAEVEGIFYTTRGNLVQEVKDVFDSLVKKVLDLDHTRGIVMGATSDIDYMVNQCLLHAHGQLDDDGKKRVVAEALSHIERHLKEFAEAVEALRSAASLDVFFDQHHILTAYDRLHLLADVLKLEVFDTHKPHRKSVTSYMTNVVPHRNIFGHKIAEPGSPKKIVNNKGEEIDVDKAREIRRLILSLRGDFRTLLQALQPPPAAR
jgi:hypothetical protein